MGNFSDFGQGSVSKSVSSQTLIRNGEKVKVTTTTVRNADGTVETETVEERTDRNGAKTVNRVTDRNQREQIKYRN